MATTVTNEMKILVATDCHLGYKENHLIRGKDAIETFDEILQIATDREVDFVLLGGDLFHKSKPSKEIVHDCMEVLRKHCLGQGDPTMKLVSDQGVNFKHCAFPGVNYEDESLRIKMPIFTIHGNHDDTSGKRNISAVDIVSVSGLVNYFGKYENYKNVDVHPLVFTKGNTKLALYGVGAMRYDRMSKLFSEKKINFIGSEEEKENQFNMFVLHQNRSSYGQATQNFVDEQVIPKFFNLVIWGHEHESKITPTERYGVPISQPGSTIITALNKTEAKPKHVGLLKVTGKECKMEKIQLKTVRPLYLKDIHLSETGFTPDEVENITERCATEVESLINKATTQKAKFPPLIRLKVFLHGGYQSFNKHRFGLRFTGRVANQEDIVLFVRGKANTTPTETEENYVDRTSIESLVHEYFVQRADNQLSNLSQKNMTEAVENFVKKQDSKAIENYIKQSLEDIQDGHKRRMETGEEMETQEVQPQNSAKNLKVSKNNLSNILTNWLDKKGYNQTGNAKPDLEIKPNLSSGLVYDTEMKPDFVDLTLEGDDEYDKDDGDDDDIEDNIMEETVELEDDVPGSYTRLFGDGEPPSKKSKQND